MAVAALGPGFRGQKVQIPSEDLASVKAKVKAAWSEANPDRQEDEMPPVLKATEEVLMETQDIETVEKADKPSYEDLEAALEKANARLADMEKEMGAMKKPKKAAEGDMEDDEDLPEFLRKEAPEEVRKAFESLQKAAADAKAQAEAVEAELRKERAERADAEAIVKARSAYANLGLDPEQVGPALRRLADADADLAKSVEDVLAAANAKVESADIFSEIGKSARPAGTAYEKAEAMAKAAVADGKSATFEQALSDVFTSDGDLYMTYLAEQGK
jgi:predicted  nucleic acid-binding Zn-ribbon protein